MEKLTVPMKHGKSPNYFNDEYYDYSSLDGSINMFSIVCNNCGACINCKNASEFLANFTCKHCNESPF